MANSADKILEEVEEERIRRSKLTKEGLQIAYNELEKENFPADKRIKFAADLGGCKEIAYHYELICKDWEEDKKLNLENSFDKHGREGIEFLFEQIDKADNERLKIFTAFFIAKLLSQLRHRDFYLSFCEKLIPIIISLVDTKDNILRQKLIIALGWTATSKEIDLLVQRMLYDEDALCRAWSATSLMQMSFHFVNVEAIREKTNTAFIKSISEEKDLYACKIIIEAAQTVFGKRWISSSEMENIAAEKIEKTKKSAIRFLSKYKSLNNI